MPVPVIVMLQVADLELQLHLLSTAENDPRAPSSPRLSFMALGRSHPVSQPASGLSSLGSSFRSSSGANSGRSSGVGSHLL